MSQAKVGQKIILETVKKIEKLKEFKENNNLDFYIEADGGINLETCKYVKIAGADIMVAGTSVINAKDYKEVINKLKK